MILLQPPRARLSPGFPPVSIGVVTTRVAWEEMSECMFTHMMDDLMILDLMTHDLMVLDLMINDLMMDGQMTLKKREEGPKSDRTRPC